MKVGGRNHDSQLSAIGHVSSSYFGTTVIMENKRVIHGTCDHDYCTLASCTHSARDISIIFSWVVGGHVAGIAAW